MPGPDRGRQELDDSPVVITKALVNPPGPDGQPGTAPETVTLSTCPDREVDLNGWRIRNKAGEAQTIAGVRIPAKGSVTLFIPKAPLSNKGGTITLLNGSGLKVHGVSYSKEQAEEGVTVVFA